MAATTTTDSGERVFLRKASGLIKTASNTDVFIFDLGLVSIGLGLAFLLFFGPAAYPGSNLYVATLIAGLAMLCVGGGMICWTLTIPRSGGIYVFGTRSMWPPLAFTLSFCEASAWIFYSAFGAYYLVQIGISPMFATLGIIAHSSGLETFGTDLANKWPTFLIAGAFEIVGAVVLASGMRRFFFTQKIVFTAAVLGTLIFIFTLLATSRHTFISNFNNLMGPRLGVGHDAYHGVINAAHKNGFSEPGYNWKQTLYLANWAFLPLIGSAFSISIGGEIKQVAKGQTRGIFAAIVGSVIVWIICFALSYKMMGHTFLGAVTFSSLNGVASASTPVVPYATLLTGLGTSSEVLTVLVSLGFIAWIWLWMPSQIGYGNRAVMAWSLDRIFPDALGKVSNRTHTPVPAIAFATVAAIAFLAVLSFTTFFQLVVFIEVGVLAWAIVLLAGVFFPYRRPDIYEKSPIANIKVLGLPVMSVACGLGAIAALAFLINLLFDGVAAGHSSHSLSVLIGWFVGAFVLYWVLWLWRRRQGVNVNLAFKEIPIE
jgi:basic amino acid/polyamine antiporter, APA family